MSASDEPRRGWGNCAHVPDPCTTASRLAEELQQERVRLANRIRQQLWRYYPQLLELTDDLTAEWILELWAMAPTPTRAARLREATIAKLLSQHRIRRLDAAGVLGVLRQPAITVAAGVTEAAVLHLHSLVARLHLANTEFHQAERKLDELCAPCPGSARSRSPPCSPRRGIRSRAGTTPRSGPSRA
jgi:hypothetical protein